VPGRFDFSSVLPMVRAARETGTQVIWDLLHYGWPDDVSPFAADFTERFARFARACAAMVAAESDAVPFWVPVNEISFFAWAGGDAGFMNPFVQRRGLELKVQLVRAAIEAIESLWSVDARARIVHVEPAINVIPNLRRKDGALRAADHHESQFEAWEILGGHKWPGIGGDPKYLDVLGINYYYNNQWIQGGMPVTDRRDPRYRPLREILAEIHRRFGRPLFIGETGIEGEAHINGKPRYRMPVPRTDDARPEWLRYVCGEVAAAMDAGVPMEGICLYPVANHPGWEDGRHCQNGLFDYPPHADGHRDVIEPLARELAAQVAFFETRRAAAVSESRAPSTRGALLQP
jgi:polysaccharide biosynthesis protein PelF